MTFEQMLRRAKGGDQEAVTSILLMYRPLLLKYAVINGRLDEDLYRSCASHWCGRLNCSGFKFMRKTLRLLSQGLSRGLKIFAIRFQNQQGSH